jgi:DNA-binding NarL/FixJ family response regulator
VPEAKGKRPDWLPEFDRKELLAAALSSPKRQAVCPGVTDREMQILAGLASGRTYREIASLIRLQPKTVKNQGLVMLRKLSSESRRVEALGRFVELIRPDLPRGPGEERRHRLWASLTEREQSMLDLIGHGVTDREISTAYEMAEKSVKNLNHGLYVKIGVTNRNTAAMLWLLEQGD